MAARRRPWPLEIPWASDRYITLEMKRRRKNIFPSCAEGDALWGFGLTEPTAGSDAGGSKTTEVKDGDDWVINGSKIFITNAACEMTLGVTVQAVTGKREDGRPEYTCFIVEGRHKRVQGGPHA